MNVEGWQLAIWAKDLPLDSNSFLILARHPRLKTLNFDLTLASSEKNAITAALALCDNNMSKAAKRLGIAKGTLYRKVKQYGIDFKKQDMKELTPPIAYESQGS